MCLTLSSPPLSNVKKEICERFVVLPPSQCEKENRRIIIEISLQDLHTPARKSVQTTCQQASTMWEGKIKLNERRWPGLVKTTLEYILIQVRFAHINCLSGSGRASLKQNWNIFNKLFERLLPGLVENKTEVY